MTTYVLIHQFEHLAYSMKVLILKSLAIQFAHLFPDSLPTFSYLGAAFPSGTLWSWDSELLDQELPLPLPLLAGDDRASDENEQWRTNSLRF